MDPNACYRRYLRALLMHDADEATAARNDLLVWLDGKGFEPTWTLDQRHAFLSGHAPPESPKTIKMPRSKVAGMLDKVRQWLAEGVDAHEIERRMAMNFSVEPLQPCDGEAHSNAHIDNCMCCAPRWGFVGPAIQVT